jgi:hypothetical protein
MECHIPAEISADSTAVGHSTDATQAHFGTAKAVNNSDYTSRTYFQCICLVFEQPPSLSDASENSPEVQLSIQVTTEAKKILIDLHCMPDFPVWLVSEH